MAGQILNSYVEVASLCTCFLQAGNRGPESAVRAIWLQHTVLFCFVCFLFFFWSRLQERVTTGHDGTTCVTFCRIAGTSWNQHSSKSSPEKAVFPIPGKACMRPMPSRPKIEEGLPRWMRFWDTEMEYQTRPDCHEQASESTSPELLTSLTATTAGSGNSC